MKTFLPLIVCFYLIVNVNGQSTSNEQKICASMRYPVSNNEDIKKGIADLGVLITQQCGLKDTADDTSDTNEQVTDELRDLIKHSNEQVADELKKINYNLELLKQTYPTPIPVPTPLPNQTYPFDCQGVADQGLTRDGIYTIQPRQSGPFQIYCEFEYESRDIGWNVIQYRDRGAVDFNRSWDEYKNGFGDLNGEFWLGNDKIRNLTLTDEFLLHFEAKKGSFLVFGTYEYFDILSEADRYKMSLGKYISGSTWLKLYSQYRDFSTYDRDSTRSNHCGDTGGWWYHVNSLCSDHGNLNGLYGCETRDCMYIENVYVTSSTIKMRRMIH